MILQSQHLLMREFVEADWQVIFDYQSDPLYWSYYDWTERSQSDVHEFVQMFIDQQTEKPRTKFQFAVVLKQENQVIGNCGIRISDQQLREANIGYELNSKYWGQGYATEAALTILKFGFEDLKMHRICSWCVAQNIASVRVLEKIGMRREGHFLEKEFIKGKWYDTFLYAILDREWVEHIRKSVVLPLN